MESAFRVRPRIGIMPDRRIQMATDPFNVPDELGESALRGRGLGSSGDKAAVILASNVMFEEMLTGWASDWLRLLARRLDRPVTEGRFVSEDGVVSVSGSSTSSRHGNWVSMIERADSFEIDPLGPIPAQTYHRRSTVDRVRRRAS